jgi:uncharacterized FAD-dependent dehydrogenase
MNGKLLCLPYSLLNNFFFIVTALQLKVLQSSQFFCTYRKQREFERRAATMGGGNFVVPAQRVTDFISNRLSGTDIANTFEVASN